MDENHTNTKVTPIQLIPDICRQQVSLVRHLMQHDKEMTLVLAVCRGERGALAQFIERYQGSIKLAIRFAGQRYGQRFDEDQQADLWGDLLVALVAEDFRKLRSYQGRSSLRQWLKIVASNMVIDQLRRHRPQLAIEDLELAESSPSPFDQVLEREERALIDSAMSALNDEDRLFVELYYKRGHDFEGVAELMGTTLGAVYARKNRIRKKLILAIQKREKGQAAVN